MLRKTLIALIASAAVGLAFAPSGAEARHGGGGGGGHMGGGHVGGFSGARVGGFSGTHMGGARFVHGGGMHRIGGIHRAHFHNRFFFRHHHRRFLFAGGFPLYASDYSCYRWVRVPTPWGWHWRHKWVCSYYY